LSQPLYLPIHLIQRLSDAIFQSGPPVVGKVARKPMHLLQEHAHVP
jgi:hypothetical protein